jgi:hypothetical protein
MNVATSSKTGQLELSAAVFAPVKPVDFYEAVLDVRGFPAWAPGVRRVEVLSGGGGAGMLSEWEVSFLGFRRTVHSVLLVADGPSRLRWSYGGPVEGRGACSIEPVGEGALASFRTALAPADPFGVPGAGCCGPGRGPDAPQALPLPARPAGGGR